MACRHSLIVTWWNGWANIGKTIFLIKEPIVLRSSTPYQYWHSSKFQIPIILLLSLTSNPKFKNKILFANFFATTIGFSIIVECKCVTEFSRNMVFFKNVLGTEKCFPRTRVVVQLVEHLSSMQEALGSTSASQRV